MREVNERRDEQENKEGAWNTSAAVEVSAAMVARRGSSWRWAPRRGREEIRRTGEWTPRVRVVGEKSEDSNVQGEKEMQWMGHTWPQIWLIYCCPVIQLCPTLRSRGGQHTKASLSFTISWSLHKLMLIKLGMPSNHLILCRPLLLLPSIFPSIRVFSNESGLCIRWPKYWSFTISPSKEYWRLISFRIDWLDLLAVQTILQSLLHTRVWKHQFFGAKPSLRSNSHIRTWLLETLADLFLDISHTISSSLFWPLLP